MRGREGRNRVNGLMYSDSMLHSLASQHSTVDLNGRTRRSLVLFLGYRAELRKNIYPPLAQALSPPARRSKVSEEIEREE